MRTYGKLHRKGEKKYRPTERDFREEKRRKRVKLRREEKRNEYQDFKRYGRSIEWEK